jgi:hypothetical protein
MVGRDPFPSTTHHQRAHTRSMSPHPAAPVPCGPTAAAGVLHVDDPELDDLRLAILARLRHTLVDLDNVRCRLDHRGSNIMVHLAGPAITEMRRHAVAVRVLDAVRSMGRTYGHVDVDYQTVHDGDAPAT